MHYVR